jgi:hypothetical protein
MATAPQSSYITDAWHNLPKYVCPGCGYDTLRTVQMEVHQQHCAAFRAMVAVATTADPTDTAGPRPPEDPAPEPEPEPEPVPVPDEPDEPDDEPHPVQGG